MEEKKNENRNEEEILTESTEKKKKGFFQKLSENVKLQVCFFVVSMLVLVILYLPLVTWIKTDKTIDKILNSAVAQNSNILSEITKVENAGKRLVLYGWVIRLNTEKQEVKVVLSPLNTETEQEIIAQANQAESLEVVKYLDYLKQEQTAGSGFTAEIKREKLAEDVCYEVLLYVTAKGDTQYISKVSTNQYLYNSEIYAYNPLEFSAPEFTDEQMNKVVEEGYLLGYTMEYGAWVYQYEDSLYWILDKNVGENVDEDLYMFFHLNTSTLELLPEKRQQYGFDNMDFTFTAYQIQLDEESNYRVAVRVLDVEYSITSIVTGDYFEKRNLWKVSGKLKIQ